MCGKVSRTVNACDGIGNRVAPVSRWYGPSGGGVLLHTPEHAVGGFVTHLHPAWGDAVLLQILQHFGGMMADILLDLLQGMSLPTQGNGLFGRVHPPVAIVEVNHDVHSEAFGTEAFFKHVLAVAPLAVSLCFGVNPYAATDGFAAVVAHESRHFAVVSVGILYGLPLAFIFCGPSDVGPFDESRSLVSAHGDGGRAAFQTLGTGGEGDGSGILACLQRTGLYDGRKFTVEGMVLRQVEEFEVCGIAVGCRTESTVALDVEADERIGIRAEIAVLVHYAHAKIIEVVAVGLQTMSVLTEHFEVMGLACRADSLLEGVVGIICLDADFARLVLHVVPHQTVTFGDVAGFLARLLALYALTAAVDKEFGLGRIGIDEYGSHLPFAAGPCPVREHVQGMACAVPL